MIDWERRLLEQPLPPFASEPAVRAVHAVQAALRDADLASALRQIDRAWRCLPDDAQTIAPIYGRLLALEERDPAAALRLLTRAAQFGPDPELQALIVLTLTRLGRAAEALDKLNSALEAYCLEPDHALTHVSAQVLQEAGVSAPGWVGMTPNLDLVWQLAPGLDPGALRIEADGQALKAPSFQTAKSLQTGAGRLYRWSLPAELRDAHLRFLVDGVPLAGGGTGDGIGRSGWPDFSLDGRASSAGSAISGWACIGWAPATPVKVQIQDVHGRQAWIHTRCKTPAQFCWPFALDLRSSDLRGNRFEISAQLPDGRMAPLPDTPLLLESAVRLPPAARHDTTKWSPGPQPKAGARASVRRAAVTDVIVPVYGAREETLACLESVLATVGPRAQVVVVDDGTRDAKLSDALDELAAAGDILLLRNASNLGYVASVNRALALHPTHDAVLLNSDTLVFGNWLQRLQAAAYSANTVGTATPFTNNGSFAAYPYEGFADIGPNEAAALDAIAAAANAGVTAPLPVGVGHCLYLRRDCLRAVGAMDEAVFGRGYGEETDFCLRARALGWSSRLAADVFIFHAGSRSFGQERTALIERNHRLINLRHPGYDEFLKSYADADPLRLPRRRLDERRLSSLAMDFALIVTLALPGGVDRFVGERCRELREQGLLPLVLRPAHGNDTDDTNDTKHASGVELWTDALAAPNLCYAIPSDLAALRQLLGSLRIAHVEIQHFLHVDARVVDAVRSLGRPYDVYLHDYAWFCPRITLIDRTERYCGEPALHTCEACVRNKGSLLAEPISVAALRHRSAAWLAGARAAIAPSSDCARRYERHFAGLQVRVESAGPPLVAKAPMQKSIGNGIVRVALIGALGRHKGYAVLLECARDAARRGLPLEFVVIGYTEDDQALLKTGKVFVTGRYSEGEAPHLLARERPHLVFMASVWPETWCYALDHAIGAGLPVVAFDLGAIAERLRAGGLGVLLALDSTARQINDGFLRIAARNEPVETDPSSARNLLPVPLLKPAQARLPDAPCPALIEKKVPQNMSNPQPKPDVQAKEGMSAAVQILPLPVGLYLFSVRTGTPSAPAAAGKLALPALHVGLGPGVRPELVEFVAGPASSGTWLFSPADMFVVKVTGPGATLVLTSVRAPGGETLAVRIERLEGRSETQAQPAAPSLAPKPAPAFAAQAAPPRDEVQLPENAVPLRIKAHIRTRGDQTYAEVPWAGRAGQGLWIESFSVQPLEGLGAKDIEYKGLTGSGFETPWITNDQMCGTKGMSVPLIGFALRLKAGAVPDGYDCQYSGYFQSGTICGPFGNGTPCRSTVANDPLEGIQIVIVQRAASSAGARNPAAQARNHPASLPAAHARKAPVVAPARAKQVTARQSAKSQKTPARRAPPAARPAKKPSARSARR